MQVMGLPGNLEGEVFNEGDLLICDQIQVALAVAANDGFKLGSRRVCAGLMKRLSTALLGGAA